MNTRATYSAIIRPALYNRLMTDQHLYIKESDHIISDIIAKRRPGAVREVVELGCGPARLLRKIATLPRLRLTGIDHDAAFVRYSKKLLARLGRRASMHLADITTYRHDRPVDIFYSQGVHHHVPKGPPTRRYLSSIYRQLRPGGCYIVSDEFLAPYRTAAERQRVMARWYAHIIAAARRSRYTLLAVEEAKTFLDDLAEGKNLPGIKTPEQLDLVLSFAPSLDAAAAQGNLKLATNLAQELLHRLAKLWRTTKSGDDAFDVSRGDYKISGEQFRREVAAAGFTIARVWHLGPLDVSGGFSIYLLSKE